MGNGFFPGIVVGMILGVLVTMIGLAVLSAMTKASTPKVERDPADWWKHGGEPPC